MRSAFTPSDISPTTQHRNWVVCHDCGHAQPIEPSFLQNSALGQEEWVCSNCGGSLGVKGGEWLDKATAMTVAAFIFFIGAHVFDFFTLVIGSTGQTITILSGASALITREEWILASLVLVTTFLLPIFEILALLYLLVSYRFNKRLPGQVAVMRWLERLQHWVMHDVFLLGVLVTTVKLGDKAIVIPAAALPLFFLLVACLQASYWFMDKRKIWNWLNVRNCFAEDEQDVLIDCDVCKAMVGSRLIQNHGKCPRCHSTLHVRIPQSIQKTIALMLAAAILYIPANFYYIMLYSELGTNYDSTIMSGVIDLAAAGLWFIALVVFVASIVVPILKLLMLGFLVWSVQVRMTGAKRIRMWMYRTTKFIGRWSMVDVYVVTLLTAVVQFGFIGQVEPGAALLPFAAVVVLTMLATESFDPRLIWDRAAEGGGTALPERTLAQLSQAKNPNVGPPVEDRI